MIKCIPLEEESRIIRLSADSSVNQDTAVSSNVLKICAIIIMVIDHIAAYMYQDFNQDIYNENIKSFETDYMSGIEHYNELYCKIAYGHQIRLYKDSAEKIGHPELAYFRGCFCNVG